MLLQRHTRTAVAIAALLWVAPAVAQPFTPSSEKPEDYPAGAGREQTFYTCTACHGFKIVAQQGQSRRQWDDTLDFMSARHNMPKLADADRKTVLDYLEASFPPRSAPGGFRNPFTPR
jgi:mono/diheme cytochrome c family protein